MEVVTGILKLAGIGSAALLIAVGCSNPKSNQTLNQTSSIESQHLFVSYAPTDWVNSVTVLSNFTTPSDRAACEMALQKAVCETTLSADELHVHWSNASCAADSAKYVPAIMAFYDEMPERLRPSLCSINKIFISEGITSTAFASPILNDPEGAPIGAYIGARKSTFLQQPTARALVTWKEQLPFGGSQTFLANDPKLLQINYGIKTQLSADGLFYVLIHEMGHLIDFNNHAVQTNCARNDRFPGCRPVAGTFSALSWSSYDFPLRNASYLKQDQFCYYNCSGGTISSDDAFDIYSSMVRSAFITPYSGVNMGEDFAEFFVWNLLSRYKGVDYRVQFPGHGEIDMNQGLVNSPLIHEKLEFMDRLWNTPGLKISNQ